MTAPDVIVTMRHLRTVPGFSPRPGFCARGGREFFRRHGLDWGDFLRNGIPASRLEATGDGLALALAAHARNMEAGDGR